jgi:four helix bundle protein
VSNLNGQAIALDVAMSRDYRKLRVFDEADALILDIYRATSDFPEEERYGLRAQIRRGAVSSAANIVEGSSRRTTPDFCRFLEVAHGSAREVEYLLSVARRLDFMDYDTAIELEARYSAVQGKLQRLMDELLASERS